MHYAVYPKSKQLLVYLKNNCHLSLIEAEHRNGRTPLHIAAEEDNLEAAKYICSQEPTALTIADHDGNLPIHYAAKASSGTRVLNYFLQELKLDPNTKNTKDGQTPLHSAAIGDNVPAAKLLLETYGANPRLSDKNGWTAAIYTAGWGSFHILDYLLEKDPALLYLKDKQDHPLEHFQVKKNIPEIKAVLAKHKQLANKENIQKVPPTSSTIPQSYRPNKRAAPQTENQSCIIS